MFDLAPRSGFSGILNPGAFGKAGARGVAISERTGLSALAILARQGAAAPLDSVVQAICGLSLPDKLRLTDDDRLTLLWAGPQQWLALSADPALMEKIADSAAPFAALTDQTGGRAVLRVSGPKAREVLRKGVTLDLHPDVFKIDDATTTAVSHINALIWRSGEDTYDFAVARSFSGSFWHWLSVSAAEFGGEVV